MKKIYFYSTLFGLGMGTLYISIGTSNPVTNFLNSLGKRLDFLGGIDGVIAVLVYLGILILPLVVMFFLVTSVIWEFVGNFKNKYPFSSIVKINLFFWVGILLSLFYLGLFVQLR